MMAINSVGASAAPELVKASATEDSVGEEFSGAIAAADLVAAQAIQKPVAREGGAALAEPISGQLVAGVPHSQEKGQGGAQEAGKIGALQSKASGRLDRVVPQSAGGSADNASLIQKMAVSSNTGADIAGLKPWNSDWVFEGGLNRHPMQKTLIEDAARGGSANALKQLEQMLQAASASTAETSDENMLQALSGAGASAPGGLVADSSQIAMGGVMPQQPMGRNSLGKTMGSDEFVNARQASNSAKQQKGVIGTQQGLMAPGGALKAPPEVESKSEVQDRKAKIPDTLGLIHPQGGKAELAGNSIPFPAAAGAMKMDAGVVAGSMSRNRLSSESVGGLTQSIRQLGNGGEVRIRLKPDHLGELHLKVSTGGKSGGDVGLQIQASDSQAKKILEESLGSLRESLAAQNLSLGKVDVQVAQPSSSSSSAGDSSQDRPGLSGQQGFSANSGDSGNRGSFAREGASGTDAEFAGRSSAKPVPRQAAAAWGGGGGGGNRAAASSRIDVIA